MVGRRSDVTPKKHEEPRVVPGVGPPIRRGGLVLHARGAVAADVVGDLRLKDEPLLTEVFSFIEERYREPISLRDVARAATLS